MRQKELAWLLGDHVDRCAAFSRASSVPNSNPIVNSSFIIIIGRGLALGVVAAHFTQGSIPLADLVGGKQQASCKMSLRESS